MGSRAIEISDDPGRLDVDRVHRWLSESAYWALGRPRDVVERSIAGSLNLGAYVDGELVGYARVVTDRATFAWLCDVYVDESVRGGGVGKALVGAVVGHPDLQGLKRFLLATADAHGLYAGFGFEPIAAPERWMERSGGGR